MNHSTRGEACGTPSNALEREFHLPARNKPLELTKHAVQVMEERMIPREWVEHTVANPELRLDNPNDPELESFFRRIPERGGRALRVVVNTRVARWRVVSVYFDRRMRKEPYSL